jgi:hypothetical protein
MFKFYDIYESDGSEPRWYVGTVRVLASEDGLKSRYAAITKARKALGYGYKVHTKLSDKSSYSVCPLITPVPEGDGAKISTLLSRS